MKIYPLKNSKEIVTAGETQKTAAVKYFHLYIFIVQLNFTHSVYKFQHNSLAQAMFLYSSPFLRAGSPVDFITVKAMENLPRSSHTDTVASKEIKKTTVVT